MDKQGVTMPAKQELLYDIDLIINSIELEKHVWISEGNDDIGIDYIIMQLQKLRQKLDNIREIEVFDNVDS